MIYSICQITIVKAGNNDFFDLNNKDLYAKAAILIDGDNGRILYEKNGHEKVSMASTTKIMTCIIALEYGNLDDIFTVSSYAASMPKVKLGVITNEQYKLKDLLYALMLESDNDVAVVIAEGIGGSVENFSALMNQKARDLGCYDTNFVTPNGLDDENHYSTAYDMALIGRYAIKNEAFLQITNTASYSFCDANYKRNFYVANHNRFLDMMNGAIGIKTGFTNQAGYCFVGALKKDDKTFISVVLGSGWPPNKSYKWSDTKSLVTYGLENYKYQEIFETDHSFNPVYINDGQENYVTLSMNLTNENESLCLLMRDDESVKIIYSVPDSLTAPIKEGTIVGNVKYFVNDELIQIYPVYTCNSVLKKDYKWYLNRLMQLLSF